MGTSVLVPILKNYLSRQNKLENITRYLVTITATNF
ncbi:Hypothetical protein BHY_1503 (plasmid) [Borrelia nietonii YOR]|uniref:Uncharacterized protein n=1 Tax=Borrelia nietonii YOR TaxID=1293576 RepID=W5SCR3_9SPIR|nr:Hypothetical protein BHY_1503 [Borrelia nietonii YOR]